MTDDDFAGELAQMAFAAHFADEAANLKRITVGRNDCGHLHLIGQRRDGAIVVGTGNTTMESLEDLAKSVRRDRESAEKPEKSKKPKQDPTPKDEKKAKKSKSEPEIPAGIIVARLDIESGLDKEGAQKFSGAILSTIAAFARDRLNHVDRLVVKGGGVNDPLKITVGFDEGDDVTAEGDDPADALAALGVELFMARFTS
jgi:hypothetical protein